jgi:NAD(P)-dependent dehydrogenase (short-subunit alcohol dehydrogenase family)
VVIADIDDEAARATLAEFKDAGITSRFVHADVARDGDLQAMIDYAIDSCGALDILVNNAGIGMNGVIPGAPPEVWPDVLHVYLRQYMLGTQLALRAMGDRGGAVVNIASSAGVGFSPHAWPEYATAKAGVIRFTACMAPLRERGNDRVNCICPGWVATEGVRASIAGLSDQERRSRDIPEPMLTPEDIGDAVIQLVRDEGLAGRVMLYYEPGRKRLLPPDLDLFALSEEA